MADDLPMTDELRRLSAELLRAQQALAGMAQAADRLDREMSEAGATIDRTIGREQLSQGMAQTTQRIRETEREIERLGTTSREVVGGRSMFNAENVTALATSYTALRQGLSDAARIVEAIGQGAAADERRTIALRNLGATFERIQETTRDTVDEVDAFDARQRIMAAGLDLTDDQFVAVVRAARDYAVTVGTETSQEVDRLTSALISGSERGLRPFGVSLRGIEEPAQRAAAAIQQFIEKQRLAEPAQRTFAEEQKRANNELEDAKNAAAGAVAALVGLRGVYDGLATGAGSISAGLNDIAEAFGEHGELRTGIDTFAAMVRTALGPIALTVDAIVGSIRWISENFPDAPRTSDPSRRGVPGIGQAPTGPSQFIVEGQMVEGRRRGGGGGGRGRAAADMTISLAEAYPQRSLADELGLGTGEGALGRTPFERDEDAAFIAASKAREASIATETRLLAQLAEKKRGAVELTRQQAEAWDAMRQSALGLAQGGLGALTSGMQGFVAAMVQGADAGDAALQMLKGLLTQTANALVSDGTFKLFKGLGDLFIPGLQAIAPAEIGIGSAEIGAGLALTAAGASIQVPVPSQSAGGAAGGGAPPAAASSSPARTSRGSGAPIIINVSAFDPDSSARAVMRALDDARALGYR